VSAPATLGHREARTSLLAVEDLHVSYGAITALRGISLEVGQGEVVALIGANGAGKTSTLRAISGMLRPRSGKIALGGEQIQGLKANVLVPRGMAHAPEGRGIFLNLTVLENLELGAYVRTDTEGIAEDLAYVYGLFPRLRERQKQVSGTLSGGEQQMLSISRALMSRPRLLLLDEPSLGLAPLIVRQIMALLRHLARDSGLTILLVEQNAKSALSIADQVVLLYLGRVVLTDAAARVSDDAELRHHYLGF